MLTTQQVNYFHTFGFLKMPGLFRDEFPRIEASFHEVWDMQGGGHAGEAHDGMRRSALVPFIDKHEYLSALIDDPRIDGIASAILGDDYNYMFSDGNFFVGPTLWHSDRYYNKPYNSLKVAFYLDRVTRDTGCLRVLPGTHNVGDRFGDSVQEAMPHSSRQNYEGMWAIEGPDIPAVPLESERATSSCSTTRSSTARTGEARNAGCSPSASSSATATRTSTFCVTSSLTSCASGTPAPTAT